MNPFRHREFEREGMLLLAVGLIFAPFLFGWLIVDMTRDQDAKLNVALCRQAEGMMEFVRRRQEAMLLDYAIWNEMYANTVIEADQGWFDDNVGFDTSVSVGETTALVLDAGMVPVLGSIRGESAVRDAGRDLPPQFRAMFDRVADANGIDHLNHYMAYRGQIALVGIARILPDASSELVIRGDDARYLVFVEIYDEAAQTELRDVMSWDDLVLTTDVTAESHLAIESIDGAVVGQVLWTAPDLAAETLRQRAPLFGAGLVLIGAATIGLFGRLRRRTARLAIAEAASRNLALADPLTGVPNRRALQVELGRRLADETGVQVLVIDFDGFKEVNDRLGHRHGDALLVEMTGRMSRHLPGDALLARIGGDEFAVVLGADPAEAMDMAQDLVMIISTPFEVPGQTVTISASVGVAGSVPDVAAEELVRRADVAMYEAKRRRAGLTMRYDERFDEQRRLEHDLDAEMRVGLDRGEFWVAYQPIFARGQDEPVAVEALARWDHPERGPISPGVFIPVAERSRFILELGEFVLRTACRRLVESGEDIALSVNLSPVQLLDAGIVEKIAAILEETGFPGERLELEVTEGYLVEQEGRAVALLNRLRALGVRISLDDFGAGYASIGYLRRFPLDKVKIDRSFVAPIGSEPQAGNVVSAVVSLCRAFDMSITAEGVETEEQAAYLSNIGCDRVQGFLLGRPSADLPARRHPRARAG